MKFNLLFLLFQFADEKFYRKKRSLSFQEYNLKKKLHVKKKSVDTLYMKK